MAALRDRWVDMLARLGVPAAVAEQSFVGIERRYSEPGRFYHTLAHIGHVLDVIDSVRDLAIELPAVQLAAWFHDAIYDSRAKDNEERSADLAEKQLRELGVAPKTVRHVIGMILSTKVHDHARCDPDCQILLDADLAILGEPAEAYEKYAADIRREYAWVPEEAYRAGRAKVLRHFLDRPMIYGIERIRRQREILAKENLQREMGRLSRAG